LMELEKKPHQRPFLLFHGDRIGTVFFQPVFGLKRGKTFVRIGIEQRCNFFRGTVVPVFADNGFHEASPDFFCRNTLRRGV